MTKPIDTSEYTMQPAVPRTDLKANIAFMGPSGAGKSLTALRTMHYLLGLDPEEIKTKSEEEYQELLKRPLIAVVDTERGASLKYANRKKFGLVFHAAVVKSCLHSKLREAVKSFAAQGYQGLIVDSFSHYWIGEDGLLALADRLSQQPGGKMAAWRDISPLERQMYDSLLNSGMHVIVTMRSKMDYQLVPGADGKAKVEKLGMAPVQRDSAEYEFDITGDISQDHVMTFRSSRSPELNEATIIKPTGREIAAAVKDWLGLE